MPTFSENQVDCDRSHGLVDSVVGNIRKFLFTDASARWLEDLNARRRAALQGNSAEGDDCRLWWTIHGLPPNPAAEIKEELRYLVLALQPGVQEFRGVHFSDGNESTRSQEGNRALQKVCFSLRVPKRRGAVNWMTDFIAKRSNETPGSGGILTLYDAWMDLRGHAASEDLILGTRSVAGFPLFLPGPKVQVGYFFISHPLPGLFYEVQEEQLRTHGQFGKVFESIRQRFAHSLALAVDMDMFTDFAARTRPCQRMAEPLERQEQPHEPLIDLSDEDPSGFVATVLLPPDTGEVKCEINEGAFLREFWACISMLSIFPDDWREPAQRMEVYGQKLDLGSSPFLPIWKLQEHTESVQHRHDSVLPYYCKGAVIPSVLEAPQCLTRTTLHDQYKSFIRLYSSIHDPEYRLTPQADLLVPFGAPSSAAGNRRRVAGFIRINCDASLKRSDDPNADPEFCEPYRKLHETVLNGHLDWLNQSLGALMILADEDLRWLHCQKNLSLFKQTYDAIRQFSNWCTSSLAHPEGGGDASLHASVLQNVWKLLMENQRLGIDAKARNELLEESGKAIVALAEALREIPGLPVTLITIWSRLWTPCIRELDGERDAFVELILKDPGLLDVLQHMILSPEDFSGDLCNIDSLERRKNPLHTDFGYPHRDAQLKSIGVDLRSAGSTAIEWTTHDGSTHRVKLQWTDPLDAKVPSRLTPVAFASVPGKISDRIGRNITAMGAVTVSNRESRLLLDAELTNIVKDDEGNTPEFITNIERLFIDTDKTAGHWIVLPLTRGDDDDAAMGYFCVLQPRQDADHDRPIVAALRDLSLSRAQAQFRAEALENEQALFEYQGAVAHGFRGAAGRMGDSVQQIIDLLKRDESANASVLQGMDKLLRQTTALGKLTADALYFSDVALRTIACTPQSATTLIKHIEDVLLAFESPFRNEIRAQQNLTSRYAGFRFRYDSALLRHALAQILDNAMRVQDLLAKQDRLLQLGVSYSAEYRAAVVEVLNSVEDDNVDSALQSIDDALRGRKKGSRGLAEANHCARKSGLILNVGRTEIEGRALLVHRIRIPVVR